MVYNISVTGREQADGNGSEQSKTSKQARKLSPRGSGNADTKSALVTLERIRENERPKGLSRNATGSAVLTNSISIQGEPNMKKYSLKSIMHSAWSIYRKAEGITFADALRMAWANAKTYNEAKAAAGTAEVTHTWAGWKNLGYEVIHESKALFKAVLLDPTTKKGTRITAYFGESQVQPIEA